jgi:AraC family cel operon transcriptional repressor
MHLINGQKKELAVGDLIWMRRTDSHGFRFFPGSGGFILTNLAFPQAIADHLRRRYFADETGFLWSKYQLPVRQRVSPAGMKRLAEWTAYLDRAPRTQLEIDRFLIDLIHRSRDQNHGLDTAELPEWLARGLQLMSESDRFADGVSGLAALCKRTPEHINATLKSTLGLTTTEALNQARMEFAASQLRISTKKILEICFDCGFNNLGHFYKLFGQHYGMSPRRYRLRHLTSVEG